MRIFDDARQVADTVLFEGYVLYPYRASAQKNQLRWQFGVLTPREWSEDGGSEPSAQQTEILLDSVHIGVGRFEGKVKSGGHTRRVVAVGMRFYQSEIVVGDDGHVE